MQVTSKVKCFPLCDLYLKTRRLAKYRASFALWISIFFCLCGYSHAQTVNRSDGVLHVTESLVTNVTTAPSFAGATVTQENCKVYFCEPNFVVIRNIGGVFLEGAVNVSYREFIRSVFSVG